MMMMKCTRRNENPLTVFEDVFGSLFNDSFGTPTKTPKISEWNPAVDIVESSDAYTLTADLPGLTKADVNLTVEEGVLTLTGERKAEKSESNKFGHRYERAYGKFSRSFELGSTVETGKIKAEFKNGMLKVELPKVEASKPYEVSIAE
jgi:HSP20 family protein